MRKQNKVWENAVGCGLGLDALEHDLHHRLTSLWSMGARRLYHVSVSDWLWATPAGVRAA